MLLSIDTSTTQIGVALYDGARVLAEVYWQGGRRHTQALAPLVDDVLRRVGFETEALQAVGVALGPGSFTGLRIGLAFAKGLALAQGLPLVGVPTLDAVAAAVPEVAGFPKLAAVLPAGRGRLAVGWYAREGEDWRAEGEAEILTAEELAQRIRKPTVVCGELTEEERARLARKYKTVHLPSPAACARRPAWVAELAWRRWQQGESDAAASLAPIYLHTGTPIPA